MPDRFETILDHHDYLLCPIPVVEWEPREQDVALAEFPFVEPAPIQYLPHHRLCHGALYVEWCYSVPVATDITLALVSRTEAPVAAVASGWTLVCSEGHTLAQSHNQATTQDDAEPFSVWAHFEPGS